LDPKLADLHYHYGIALLENAGNEHEESEEEEEADEAKEQSQASNTPSDGGIENKQVVSIDESATRPELGDNGDLEMAWESLEVARVIFDKIATSDSSIKEKLAETHQYLGQIAFRGGTPH